MSQRFVLRAYSKDGTLLKEGMFAELPIRIGRNALNDFQLASESVSNFHARIAYDDSDNVRLYDLNSTNGVFTRGRSQEPLVRVGSHGVKISGPDVEVLIGPWTRLSVTPRQRRHEQKEGSDAKPRAGALVMFGSTPVPVAGTPKRGAAAVAEAPLPAAAHQPKLPEQQRASSGASSLPPRAHRIPDLPPLEAQGAPAALPPLVSGGLPDVGAIPDLPELPHAAAQAGALPPLPNVSSDLPNLPDLPGARPNEAAVRGVVDIAESLASQRWQHRANSAKATGFFSPMEISMEQLALAGLKELATSLAPGNELATSGDLSRFVTKLHDAIDVFCRSFVPLREGYSQFISSMDLQRAALRRSRYRSSGYMQVETAKTPEAVSAALLDWTDKSLDSHQAIEGIFADLMIHQVALLDGVMQGVRALLEELSPERIEEQVGAANVFNRNKKLWQAYCDRYEELAVEDQALAHIFGQEFTDAYREYQSRKSDE